VSSAAWSGQDEADDTIYMSKPLTCSLDLLDVMCCCLPVEAVKLWTMQFRLVPRLFTTLVNQSLHQRVRRNTLTFHVFIDSEKFIRH